MLTLVVLAALQAATPVDWSADDSSRIAAIMAQPQRHARPNVIVWAPRDSLDQGWLAAFVDSLAASLTQLRASIGGPYAWQRIGSRPVEYYLSPGRFVSHASGRGAVFISIARTKAGAPFLHEAAHELLATRQPFAPFEQPDSAAEERAMAQFPLWLSEGLPDYLAQLTAARTGFAEGDIFTIGGLAKVDSVCAARLTASNRRAEIEEKVGGMGAVAALFTTDRAQVAPTFYACSQSLTKHLVERIGLPGVVALFPAVAGGTWQAELARAAGAPLAAVRREWLAKLGLGPEAAVFGDWLVTDAMCPGQCAMTVAQALAWRGRRASYSAASARFGTDVCTQPRYQPGIWTANEFLGGFRLPPSRFGITSDSTVVLDIWCPDRWASAGAFILVKDQTHLLTVWDGIVFELTRQ